MDLSIHKDRQREATLFYRYYVMIMILTVQPNNTTRNSVRIGVQSWKLSNVEQSLDGLPKIYYLERLRALKGTLSRWSWLHLQSLTPTNQHWARVVGYGPFSLRVIHKEGLCPSSGGINRLMMIT
jgi:hypothetical protein